MIPKDEIRDAVEYVENDLEFFKKHGVTKQQLEHTKVLTDLAKSHLQASDELPCERTAFKLDNNYACDSDYVREKERCSGFNECLSIVKPIVAKNYVKRNEAEIDEENILWCINQLEKSELLINDVILKAHISGKEFNNEVKVHTNVLNRTIDILKTLATSDIIKT